MIEIQSSASENLDRRDLEFIPGQGFTPIRHSYGQAYYSGNLAELATQHVNALEPPVKPGERRIGFRLLVEGENVFTYVVIDTDATSNTRILYQNPR